MGRNKTEKLDMNVMAFLERVSPEELIYFGTSKGSNFIAVDTAANVIKNIDIYDQLIRNDLTRIHDKCANDLSNLPRKIVEIQDNLEKAETPDEIDKWSKKYEAFVERMMNAYSARNNNATALRTWVPLKEREVEDTYPHTAYDKGTVILVKGKENGKYWSKEEFDLDMLRKKLK